MVPSSGAVTETVTGSQIGTTIDRWTTYSDTSIASTPVRGDIGSGWQAWTQTAPTFAGANAIVLDSGRQFAGQSLSIAGLILAELHA